MQPQLGTPEYTNYLVEQGKTLGLNLDQYKVPTSVDQSKSVQTYQTSSTKPTSGDISGATASSTGAKTGLEEYERIAKETQDAEVKRIEAEGKKTESLFESVKKTLTSPFKARQDAQAETGIVPKEYFADQKARLAEIDSLSQSYNDLVMQRDKQIAEARGGYGSVSLMDNRIAQIERNAAPRLNAMSANINAKTAVMQALQGNFREAQTFVNQAVQDATADSKFQFDLFQTTYELNSDLWSRLDKVYGESMKSALDVAKFKYEDAKDVATFAGNAMIKYNSLGAGINITDSKEEVAQKVASVGGDLELLKRELALRDSFEDKDSDTTSTISGGSLFSSDEIEDDVRAFIEELRSDGVETKEELFSRTRGYYRPNQVSDQGIRLLLGIAEPPKKTVSNGAVNYPGQGPMFMSQTNTRKSGQGNISYEIDQAVQGISSFFSGLLD
jgi:hypothetical protein